MRLRWTVPAAHDLYAIVEHIQQDNPAAASEVAEIIYDGCEELRRFPYRGRKGRINGTRELVFPGLPTLSSTGFRIQSWKSPAFITEPRTGREWSSAENLRVFQSPIPIYNATCR
jgi:plasmid stabilization system protein ParE